MPLTNFYVAEAAAGTGDGSSYANRAALSALDGKNIDDTEVWLTGLIQHKPATAAVRGLNIDIQSGVSASRKSIIRGDYPGDPAIVWSGNRIDFATFVQEAVPNDDVWKATGVISNPGSSYYANITTSTTPDDGLTEVFSVAACQATANSYYHDGDSLPHDLYVNIGEDPNDKIHSADAGITLNLLGTDDLIFYKTTLYLHQFGIVNVTPAPNRVEFRDCHIQHDGTPSYLFQVYRFSEGMKFYRCTGKDAANLFYFVSNTAGPNTSPRGYVVDRCTLENAGKVAGNQDSHAIGLMDGGNGRVTRNVIRGAGRAVVHHTDASTVPDGAVDIWGNLIDTPHDDQGAIAGFGLVPQGFAFEGDNNNTNPVDINCYYNVVRGGGIADGIAPDPQRIAGESTQQADLVGNILIDCLNGIHVSRNNAGNGASVRMRDDVIIDPVDRWVYIRSGATTHNFDFDDQTYGGASTNFPTQGFRLLASEYNFEDWKTNSGQDANSTGP